MFKQVVNQDVPREEDEYFDQELKRVEFEERQE